MLEELLLDQEIKKKKRRVLLVVLLVPLLAGTMATLPQAETVPPPPTAVAEAAETVVTARPTENGLEAGMAPDVTPTEASASTEASAPTDTPAPPATPSLGTPEELPPTGASRDSGPNWMTLGLVAWLAGALLWWLGEKLQAPALQ